MSAWKPFWQIVMIENEKIAALCRNRADLRLSTMKDLLPEVGHCVYSSWVRLCVRILQPASGFLTKSAKSGVTLAKLWRVLWR
jgi:hypothetical protein